LIIQAEMKHYRIPFFTLLYDALKQDGIELTVAYSNSNPFESARNDRADLPAPIGQLVPGRWFFGRFLYQPLWRQILDSDLVIIGAEIKFLVNAILIIMSRIGIKTVAFWGLGPNNHSNRSQFAELIKKHFFSSVDWWFAYTDSVADYLRQRGMPEERITDVQNATDSAELIRLMSEIPDEEVIRSKISLTGAGNSQIGLYCGLIGDIKDIPMLLETARLVKLKLPSFHLVIIGNGPDRAWLEDAIASEPWIHYLSSKFGRESALYYKMADVFLLAGTAGLAVVDSFAAGLPFLGTRLPTHPPEVSYVIEGENGCLAPHEPHAFANAIVTVLSDPVIMRKLCRGAEAAGKRYTIQAMVDNFKKGIEQCLVVHGKSVDPKSANLAFPECS
jgi:glycosyltransferase involved in cell wall biosynthesis